MGKRIEYDKVVAGEWIQPVRKGYRMACCDCGLVHTMDFRVHKGKPQLRAYRNNQATTALRKRDGIKVPR